MRDILNFGLALGFVALVLAIFHTLYFLVLCFLQRNHPSLNNPGSWEPARVKLPFNEPSIPFLWEFLREPGEEEVGAMPFRFYPERPFFFAYRATYFFLLSNKNIYFVAIPFLATFKVKKIPLKEIAGIHVKGQYVSIETANGEAFRLLLGTETRNLGSMEARERLISFMSTLSSSSAEDATGSQSENRA